MALTEKVEEKLTEAEGVLRDALFWASKNEKPQTISAISSIIMAIDNTIKMEQYMDRVEQVMKKSKDNPLF